MALVVVACVACSDAHPSLADLVSVSEVTPTKITATITQLVDHAQPNGDTFEQHLVIYPAAGHTAPVVVDIEGYELGGGFGVHEVTNLVSGTEVQIEHRFFGASMPGDWSTLTVEQSAGDVHHVVETLRQYFSGQWIGTGISKGGVEALYHRELYPDDVIGTVAYVAPASTSLRDERYATFVAGLGDAACRSALVAFERTVLTQPRRTALAAALANSLQNHTLEVLGADRILELATRETPFTFWQYGNASRCSAIPDDGSSDADIIAFIGSTNALVGWSDQGLAADQGYWYAAAVDLGYPADDYAAVSDLVRYLDPPTPLQTTTVATPPAFDPEPLIHLNTWLAGDADRVLLVYGERDPWTAGAFTELSPGVETHLVPDGNHLSRLRNLPAAEFEAAAATIAGWEGRNVLDN